jgi:hypothetical protein
MSASSETARNTPKNTVAVCYAIYKHEKTTQWPRSLGKKKGALKNPGTREVGRYQRLYLRTLLLGQADFAEDDSLGLDEHRRPLKMMMKRCEMMTE